MRWLPICIFLLALRPSATGQSMVLGKVLDAEAKEPLPGVHILGYQDRQVFGSSTNSEGEFILQQRIALDSIHITCIGYESQILLPTVFNDGSLVVLLRPHIIILDAITISPSDPLQLIREAVSKIPSNYTNTPFQIRGFYREQIRKEQMYYSVAEAVFESQSYPGQGTEKTKLKLIHGRRSETVKSTRIFEDYHPGGGPNYLMSHALEIELPEFLQESNFSDYEYAIDSTTSYDGRDVFVVGFDQKPSLKKNLWAGKIYIDATSHAFIDLSYALSKRGLEYRRHLTGTDKVMANLLGIDYEVLNRSTHYSYRRAGSTWSLHEANLVMDIQFKQPRKSIDETFTLKADMLALLQINGSLVPFSKSDTWRKNQLVKDLPGEFDEGFWGVDNYIQPEKSLTAAIQSMNVLRAATLPTGIPDGWSLLNSPGVKAYQRDSTVLLKPFIESRWKDKEQGSFLWKTHYGNFEMFTLLRITQAKDTSAVPDSGFQLGGLMVRADKKSENYILFGLGCMGNPQLKMIYQNTVNGKSSMQATRLEVSEMPIRLQRIGNRIALHYYIKAKKEWVLLREIIRHDFPSSLQTGIAGYAYFPGQAPNRQPNILIHAKGFRIRPITP